MKRILYVILAVAFIVPGRVMADDACSKDRVTTCNDTTAGDGHVYDCLMGRKDRVTPECSAALDHATDLANAEITACKPEIQRFCAQYANSDRSKIVDCLKINKNKIGPDCKSKYRQVKANGFDINS